MQRDKEVRLRRTSGSSNMEPGLPVKQRQEVAFASAAAAAAVASRAAASARGKATGAAVAEAAVVAVGSTAHVSIHASEGKPRDGDVPHLLDS